ncbi:ABC transporter permease subunit [Inquilinus sp. CAU 1745]|uniref:amino acid ABC transporter permease n=1 Tax=Inquilinus sp. CAU 1745 TaxID=3140369 RepID=UPI00325B1E3F
MLNNRRIRATLWQALMLATIIGIAWMLVSNAMSNLSARRITTGFGFLFREAGFGISETIIAYAPTDTYLRALAVGILNTLWASFLSIILATALGTMIGIARIARNWTVSGPAAWYVEVMRNVPLVVQLLFWYGVFTILLPSIRQALAPLPGVFLSNRGLYLPGLDITSGASTIIAVGCAAAIAAIVAGIMVPRARRGLLIVAALSFLGAIVAAAGGMDVTVPELRGLNFRGGIVLSPEFAALIVGLTLYTAAFIAEIVRSGIQAVPKGQWEAGAALGLSRSHILRLIVLPQALRVVVPPMASQLINTIKNSSLAVIVGYPDLVSIANTTMNQTNQAIEGVALVMAVFLTINLTISALMNLYNHTVAIKER